MSGTGHLSFPPGDLYVITNGELYVHFDSRLDSYIAGGSLTGAAVFDRANADDILKNVLTYDRGFEDWYKKKLPTAPKRN
jgi:hypothetical protein